MISVGPAGLVIVRRGKYWCDFLGQYRSDKFKLCMTVLLIGLYLLIPFQ